MALTTEQQRQVFKHLRIAQVSSQGLLAGGVPYIELTSASHAVQSAMDNLTPNGETTVAELLVQLETVWSSRNSSQSQAGLKRARDVEWFSANSAFEGKSTTYRELVNELVCTLGVQGSVDISSPLQGPTREP